MIPKLEIRISLNEHPIGQDIKNTFYPDFEALQADQQHAHQQIDLYIPLLNCFPSSEEDFQYIDKMLEAMIYHFFPIPLWTTGKLLIGETRNVHLEVEPYGIFSTMIARIANFLLKAKIQYSCPFPPYLRLGALKDVKDNADFLEQSRDLRIIGASLKDKYYGTINTIDFRWNGKDFTFTVPPNRPLVSPEDPLDSHPLVYFSKLSLKRKRFQESLKEAETESEKEGEKETDPKQQEEPKSKEPVLQHELDPKEKIRKQEAAVYPLIPYFTSFQILEKQTDGPGYGTVLQKAFTSS